MENKSTVKIFIASSAEVKEEREKSIRLITQLNKSHKHLHLEPIEWEIDMVQSNFPGKTNIQDAINPKLKESDLVVFVFYSKIGQYTLEEFRYANELNKTVFIFFKSGFSPDEESSIEAYRQLLNFKKSLQASLLYKTYSDLDEFENHLYTNLNLHLSENYAPEKDNKTADNEVEQIVQASVKYTIQMLTEKDREIERYKQNNPDETQYILTLEKEKEELRQQLSQSKEVIEKLAKDKSELTEKLSSPQEKSDLKDLKEIALEELQKGNYTGAEMHLATLAADSLYTLGQIKKIQLQYNDAFIYFELATRIEPDNGFFLEEAGSLAETMGYYDKAAKFYQLLIENAKRNNAEETKEIALIYSLLSYAHLNCNEFDKAIESGKKSLKINRLFYTEITAQIAQSYQTLSLAYDGNGDYENAIELGNESIEIYKKIFGEESEPVASVYSNLILTYNNNGEYEKGIEYGKKAIEIIRHLKILEGDLIGFIYNNMGESFLKTGQLNKAIDYFNRSLHIKKQYYPANHPFIVRTKKNLLLVEEEKKKA